DAARRQVEVGQRVNAAEWADSEVRRTGAAQGGEGDELRLQGPVRLVWVEVAVEVRILLVREAGLARIEDADGADLDQLSAGGVLLVHRDAAGQGAQATRRGVWLRPGCLAIRGHRRES